MNCQDPEFIRVLNDPFHFVNGLLETIRNSANVEFLVSLGGSMTSDIAGISAAGITPEWRRLTPAIDAEVLVLGRTVNGDPIPVSPAGIVSPVVITRACLQLLEHTPTIVDCGTFVQPKVATIQAGTIPARCLSTGNALDVSVVLKLFNIGIKEGIRLAESSASCIALAECVPGGTTTAMALLAALGFDVRNLLSSSLPVCDHNFRWNLVQSGLRNANLDSAIEIGQTKKNPLVAVAKVGDPMQAVVAGIAIGASRAKPVILAGGSQMLAVYALAQTIIKSDAVHSDQTLESFRRNTVVITTKWVALDGSANVQELASITNAPFACSCPDFNLSSHSGLQAYEKGNVKEGVGAGGAMALAHLIGGADMNQIVSAIDQSYDELVVKRPCARS